jgi:hypothetical protein
MLGNLRGRLAMMMALAMGLGAAGGFAHQAPMVQNVTAGAKRRGLFEGGPLMAPLRPWSYRGPGITMAQQKRASRKTKNVKRHRAACRG